MRSARGRAWVQLSSGRGCAEGVFMGSRHSAKVVSTKLNSHLDAYDVQLIRAIFMHIFIANPCIDKKYATIKAYHNKSPSYSNVTLN